MKTASSYWFEQGPRFFQAFPYHWVLEPPEAELNEFLKENQAIGLRYSTPSTAPLGRISYHVVYEAPLYDFANLAKWARKNVHRGLNHCSVEPISFERLAEEGWLLQLDTLARQERWLNLDQEVWRKRCLAAKDLPGFEAWGAIVCGRLAASVITFQMNDCCYLLYQQCHRDFLTEHVNNALSFVVTQTMVQRPQINCILYGLHSLDAPPSVDEFKFRMGYHAKLVRQRVVFNPWLHPLFNQVSHAGLVGLLHLMPGNPSLAKTEGMVRFYLEGKKPLEQQTRPLPLMQNKEALEEE